MYKNRLLKKIPISNLCLKIKKENVYYFLSRTTWSSNRLESGWTPNLSSTLGSQERTT